jgi:seryl-tRNA synthetase
MLDIQYIRENKDKVTKGLKARLFTDVDLIDKAIALDEEIRKLRVEVEGLRGKRNKAASEKNIEEGKKLKEELSEKEPKLSELEKELKETLYNIPNVPESGVPDGPEENKEVLRKVGEPQKFSFTPKDHLELGVSLGIIDTERASKISGTRFTYLKGDAALLELALVNFAMERLVKEGFTPVFPPMLIRKEITEGLGYWHGGGNENYYFVRDYEKIGEKNEERETDLYLVGTGEHSTVPMHEGEIFQGSDLPRKYVAFSSCFRREAGSYGKDVKGILRLHQFDKVEMVVYCKPEDAEKNLEKMLSYSEGLMKDLELPYQVVKLAAGDIGFPTAKTLDIETWLPGQDKYRETHSISTTTDYQARRLNIKYRSEDGNKYAYILNGTVFAIGRTIIAILENHQQEDGSVLIPKVLQKWMGKNRIEIKS